MIEKTTPCLGSFCNTVPKAPLKKQLVVVSIFLVPPYSSTIFGGAKYAWHCGAGTGAGIGAGAAGIRCALRQSSIVDARSNLVNHRKDLVKTEQKSSGI